MRVASHNTDYTYNRVGATTYVRSSRFNRCFFWRLSFGLQHFMETPDRHLAEHSEREHRVPFDGGCISAPLAHQVQYG
jgi:hypothetical protein